MKKKTIYLLLCFLWMIVIFTFSNQPGSESQGVSNKFIMLLDQIFHVHILSDGGWFFDVVNFLVRKAAHMSEYAILAILLGALFKEYGYRRYIYITFVCVILYACSDEVHQLFIAGRTGQLKDVGIDTLGGVCGIAMQQCYYALRSHWMMKRKKRLPKDQDS